MKLTSMVVAPLAFLVVSSLSGCGSMDRSCTELDCVDEITLTLNNLPVQQGAALPLSIQVCTGAGSSSCVTATVAAQAGQSPECVQAIPGPAPCTVDMNGTVVFSLTLSASDVAAGKVDVHVTVTSATSMMVLDKTATVTLQTSTPNGPNCPPVCHQAIASFAP